MMFTSSTRTHSSGRSSPIPLSRLETRVDVRVTLQYGGLNGETRGQRSPDAGKIIGSVVLECSFELDDSHMTAEFVARCALSLAHLVDYRRKNGQLYGVTLGFCAPHPCTLHPLTVSRQASPPAWVLYLPTTSIMKTHVPILRTCPRVLSSLSISMRLTDRVDTSLRSETAAARSPT